MNHLTSLFVIILSLLIVATRVDAIACGSNDCLTGEQCCDDYAMGPTCYNSADHTCASSQLATGSSGFRLCGLNEGACGSACFDKNNYFCCNGQLQQNGQACAVATSAPTSAPTSSVTQPPAQVNCPGASNFGGVNCTDGTTCCGAGTITPSCLPADGSKICCVHFKASTQCEANQVCGGSGGPGASSYASCGAPGTTFCNKGTGQGTFCSQANPLCCGYSSGFGFCCPEGCECNNNYYNCSCPQTTTFPTSAPTSVATTIPATLSPTTSTGITCGSRTCLLGEECCNDFVMGSTCYNPTGYTCAATTSSSGVVGSRLCGTNEGACGSACFDQANYQCCNGQLQQKGQTCSGATNSPSSAPTNAPTNSPTSVVTQAPARNNCPGYGGSFGVNCSDVSLCCGYGTISPSCLEPGKKCCTHFASSTQCDEDQVCGGSGGPGASSYARCGAPGSTFCNKGTGQGTFCSQANPLCCGYSSGFGFCCPEGCACNNNYYNCSCPSTTSIPSTSAPSTDAPVTASPLPTAGSLACGDRTCLVGDLCCNDIVNGQTCYDPSGYQCAATNYASTGAPGSLLCANNQGACGSACYDKDNYYCCNNQLRQNGQPCSV